MIPSSPSLLRRFAPSCLSLIGAALLGPLTVAAQTAVDTVNDFRWDFASSWSPTTVPNGTNAVVEIDKTAGADRDVDLGPTNESVGAFTVGEIHTVNQTDFRNRIRGGSIIFQVSDGNAEFHSSGSGGGRFEFRMDGHASQFVRLNSTLETFVNQDGESGGELRFRGSLEGSGGLILNGHGEVRLRDSAMGVFNATYNGPTIINAGMLRLRSANLMNTQSIDVYPGGQLRLDARVAGSAEEDGFPTDFTFNLGPGTLTLRGTGRDELNPVASGASGALRQQGFGTASDIARISIPIVLAEDASIHTNSEAVDGGSVLHLYGALSGPGLLEKNGAGTLHLHGVNTTRGLDIDNGTVVIESAASLSSGELWFSDRTNTRKLFLHSDHTVSLLDGETTDLHEGPNTLQLFLASNGTLTVDQDIIYLDNVEDSTRFQGDITGDGHFVKAGDGILRFTRHPKTYSGSTTVAGGVLEVSESAALPNTSSITVQSGAQLRLGTTGTGIEYSFGGPIVLHGVGRGGAVSQDENQGIRGALRYDPGAGQSDATLITPVQFASAAGVHVANAESTFVLAGSISGPGTLVRSGAGVLRITGNNSGYSGGTEIHNGVTIVGTGSALGTGRLVFADPTAASTLRLENAAQTVGSISGDVSGGGSARVELASGTTLATSQGAYTAFHGSFDGPGNLRKRGVRTLLLGGNHSLSGTLAVEQGTLINNGDMSALAGTVVNAGAAIGGSGTWGGNTEVNGTLRIHRDAAAGTFEGDVQLASDARLIYGWKAGEIVSSPVVVGGTLSVAGSVTLSVELLTPVGGTVDGKYALFESAGAIPDVNQIMLSLPAGVSGSLSVEGSTIYLNLAGTPEQDVGAILDATFGTVTAHEDGTFTAPWFGRFRVALVTGPYVIYEHETHGWQVAIGTSGPWIWDYTIGTYLWTWRDGVYPYFYSFDLGWIYYVQGTGSPRWFYQFQGAQAGWRSFN